jgi:hypothetical protein
VIFSNEVCRAFTAMSSRTLLSDHVCTLATQYDTIVLNITFLSISLNIYHMEQVVNINNIIQLLCVIYTVLLLSKIKEDNAICNLSFMYTQMVILE